MKIFNIRLNFANNSSSTHSIVNLNAKDYYDHDADSQEYGWGNFTLSSPESKKAYLGQLLAASSRNDTEANQYLYEHFSGYIEDGYIDHQSYKPIPVGLNGKINLQFFEEFTNYICRDDKVILGGNDNSDGHPYYNGNDDKIYSFFDTGAIIEKFDDYWIFINRTNGHKYRFSLDNDAINPTKSKIPELIDIKITDYCPFGCEFCYQGSTIQGKHADLTFLMRLADELAEKRVLEVALGGGEPTMHPAFDKILDLFHSRGIITNFTTRSNKNLSKYLKKSRKFNSVAFSIESYDQFKQLKEDIYTAANDNNIDRYELSNLYSFQIILETMKREEFSKILKESKFNNLVLLGFKETGRGDKYERMDDYLWLFDELKQNNIYQIGLDTLAVQKYEHELKILEVPTEFYTTKDGAFSCYIDAVNKTIAPNSYCQLNEYHKFDFNTWLERYKEF